MITINESRELKNKFELLPADNEFIDRIINRLTLYGQIPYTIPDRMIIEVIKNSARFFYKWYPEAKQRIFYHLVKRDIIKFSEASFPNSKGSGFTGYAVKLNPRVSVVMNCYECNAGVMASSMEIMDTAISIQKSSTYNNSLLGINNNLWIQEAVCKMVECRAMQSIFKHDIPFDYNTLTKLLLINRSKLDNNIVLETESQIDIQFLYNDNLFERHVIGNSKKELKRLLGSHTIQLPGEVTMNPDEICAGMEDVETVEQLVKGSSGIGDIILFR